MFRNDGECESATGSEPAFNPHSSGSTCINQIIKDAVDNGLIERMHVPIRCQVKFERFCFKALLARDVFDENFGKIWLARHGAKRGKIWAVNAN